MRDGFTKQKIICVLLAVLLCSGCGTGNQQEEPVSSVESQPAMEESKSESTEIEGEKEKPKEEIKNIRRLCFYRPGRYRGENPGGDRINT